MSATDLPDLPKTNYSPFSLEGSSLLLDAIMAVSDDAVITKGLDRVITSWNPGAERNFGYTPGEIVGEAILRLIPPSLHDEEQMILSTLRAGEQISRLETTRLTKAGEEVIVSLTISPLKDKAGRVIGVVKIARDITQSKQSDHARLRLAAIVESSDDAIMSKNLKG